MTFHDDEHRINNTGWTRNGDETEEWNEKQNQRGVAECFSIYIFSIRNEAMSWIYACKNWEDSANTWLMHTIQTVMSVDSTVLLLSKKKQSRKINAMRRVVLPKCIKKELSVISHKIWRSLLANWVWYIATRKPQPLCERGTKRELE